MGACSWVKSHELQITHHAAGAGDVRVRAEWEYHSSERLPHAAARLVDNGAMRPHLHETCKSITAGTSINCSAAGIQTMVSGHKHAVSRNNFRRGFQHLRAAA